MARPRRSRGQAAGKDLLLATWACRPDAQAPCAHHTKRDTCRLLPGTSQPHHCLPQGPGRPSRGPRRARASGLLRSHRETPLKQRLPRCAAREALIREATRGNPADPAQPSQDPEPPRERARLTLTPRVSGWSGCFRGCTGSLWALGPATLGPALTVGLAHLAGSLRSTLGFTDDACVTCHYLAQERHPSPLGKLVSLCTQGRYALWSSF